MLAHSMETVQLPTSLALSYSHVVIFKDYQQTSKSIYPSSKSSSKLIEPEDCVNSSYSIDGKPWGLLQAFTREEGAVLGRC